MLNLTKKFNAIHIGVCDVQGVRAPGQRVTVPWEGGAWGTVDAHEDLQDAVINWGKLLIAMGGALKPAKCLYYLVSFRWKGDGTWQYEANELNPDFSLGVPITDGSLVEIEHLPVGKAIKTLSL